MSKQLFIFSIGVFIFFFHVFGLAQTERHVTKAQLTKIYSQAIADFITDATKTQRVNFDTLFFGKRKNKQPDDFPDIELPHVIKKTQIRLISPEQGTIKQTERPQRIYINMIGWVTQQQADFIFVVFTNGFVHQYDYHINYRYNNKLNSYELIKLQFKGPPLDK